MRSQLVKMPSYVGYAHTASGKFTHKIYIIKADQSGFDYIPVPLGLMLKMPMRRTKSFSFFWSGRNKSSEPNYKNENTLRCHI